MLGLFPISADAISGEGQAWTGTAAVELPSLAVSATGTAPVVGTAAVALQSLTVAASGTVRVLITGTVTLPSLTVFADVQRTGAIAIQLPRLAVAAAGIETMTGTATVSLRGLTVRATGAGLPIALMATRSSFRSVWRSRHIS